MRRFTRLRKLWKKRRRNMDNEAQVASEDVLPANEAPVVQPFSLILSLPPELILAIFDWVDLPEKSQKLPLLLTPLHINSQIRSLLWQHRPFWRRLMRDLGRVATSYATSEILLNLCDVRTDSTLDAFVFRPLDRQGCMWIHSASRCLQTIKSSQSALKLLVIPSYHLSTFCFGNPSPPSDVVKISGPIAHGQVQESDRSHHDHESQQGSSDEVDSDQDDDDDDDDEYDEDDPMPHIEAMHDTIFALISRASKLETLSWEIMEWPSSEILQSFATDFAAKPSRLQLSMSDWLSNDNADAVVVLRALASRAEVLYLHEANDDGETSQYWPTASHKLCPIVLQSASSTLQHLEIELTDWNFDLKAFAKVSFDVLEALFVSLCGEDVDDEEDYWDMKMSSRSGSRCQMESLETCRVPARLLPLIQAPNVLQAGLSLERWQDSLTVIDSLEEWAGLEVLVLYNNPEADDDSMDDEYYGDAYIYEYGHRRRRTRKEEPGCEAIEEIRTIGIRIQRTARKYLRKLSPDSFELSYQAAPKKDRRKSNSDIGAESDDSDWIREAEERRVELRAEKKKKEEEEKNEKQKALSEHQSSPAT